MKCIKPIKAGFNQLGEITFSQKNHDKSIVGFEFECRKCLPCRLNIAREKAIRCIHDIARTHENNIFLTLTYDNDHLTSNKLVYLDFQLFTKSLREKVTRGITDPELKKQLYIPFMVTGEYGEKNKRPHWHVILFNYRPKDATYKYTTDQGEKYMIHRRFNNYGKKDKLSLDQLRLIRHSKTALSGFSFDGKSRIRTCMDTGSCGFLTS